MSLSDITKELLKIYNKKFDENEIEEQNLEKQLEIDRKRLDTVRKEIYTDIDNAYSNIKKEKELQLEYEISEDRKRLDKVRFDLAEQIAIEEANLLNKKPKSLI